MKLIDKHITDITSGFDEILRTEYELRSYWRPKLLTAYANRRTAFEEGYSIRRGKQVKIFLSVLFGVSFVLIGVGLSCRAIIYNQKNILWICCGGPLMVLLGLLILGAAWFSEKAINQPRTNRKPIHPLRFSSQQKDTRSNLNNLSDIYPDIRASWMAGLVSSLNSEVPDYPDDLDHTEIDPNAQGKRIFIQRLQEILDDRNYVLTGLVQNPSQAVDLILVGPIGVWIFEVKHWSGEIYWDDGGWRRVKKYYECNGLEVTRQPKIEKAPNHQWIQAASQVSRTLMSGAANVLECYPNLQKPRGGIVFSRTNASLNIQTGRPVFWGNINFWVKTLQDMEPKFDIDTRSTLQLVEALLKRHHELSPITSPRSMRSQAQQVVQETQQSLGEWVQL